MNNFPSNNWFTSKKKDVIEMTVAELKMALDNVDDELMEVVFLDCGGFIVKTDVAYVSDDEDDDEPKFVISH